MNSAIADIFLKMLFYFNYFIKMLSILHHSSYSISLHSNSHLSPSSILSMPPFLFLFLLVTKGFRLDLVVLVFQLGSWLVLLIGIFYQQCGWGLLVGFSLFFLFSLFQALFCLVILFSLECILSFSSLFFSDLLVLLCYGFLLFGCFLLLLLVDLLVLLCYGFCFLAVFFSFCWLVGVAVASFSDRDGFVSSAW
uniref:Uncharacterized protein n=1 Tax=Nelumbo nucifera TaxID=4432 RepID=A0A822YYK7_NELNU|nr:TPA_asm: hypothetical protein HUJ06_008393 [Nelumbo nucifera]